MITLKLDEEPLGRSLAIEEDLVCVFLKDGRELVLPMEWFPTLCEMTPAERERWELLGGGEGFDWPEYDLQLSVQQFLEGRREHVPPPSFREKYPRPIDLKRRMEKSG